MIDEFIRNLFGDHVVLATILMALIPLVELKGAIPFGVSQSLWGEHALTAWQACLWAVVGGFVITIILAFIFKPIYEALKDKKFFKSILNFFTATIHKKATDENNQQENNKSSFVKKALITTLFVAFPVPGTGVYTGTALAILLGLKPLWAILFVTIGNIIAGIIITTICMIFPAFTDILLYAFLALIVIYLTYKIIVNCVNKKREKESN